MRLSDYLRTTIILVLAISFLDVIEAKKKKKGQNPPKKKEKVPEKSKLRLIHWFGNMSDISYRCPATEYPNYKRIVQIAHEPITTVTECSVEGARWDYDIKLLENETPKRRDDFNGHALVTFAKGNEQGKFKQGLKLGKCFLLKDEKIREIRGNFKNNVLQGNVTVKYRNDTILVGQVHDNKFIDIVRRFDRNDPNAEVELQTIETADGRILWQRHNEFSTYLFKTQTYNNSTYRIIMTEDFINFYECWENNRYYLSHCYKLQSHLPVMLKGNEEEMSCNTTIGEQKRLLDKVALHSVEGIHTIMYFWYNLITKETWEKDTEKFPHCVWNEPGKGVSIWNSNGTENVQKNVGDWLKLMSSRDYDPYWFHAADPSDGPWLDQDKPELNVTIKYFVNRPMYYYESIVIKSHNKILYRGRMINGTIRDKLDPHVHSWTHIPGVEEKPIGQNRTLYDWGAPLQIVIGAPEEGKPMFQKEDKYGKMKDHKLIVYGRIMEGKLDGHVRIFGRIPNDPLLDCNGGEKLVEEGLGYIGRYKDGVPTGFAWKGLIGGAWIYGKVDEMGEFTGHNVAYVNQDLKTLYVGTFENGLMVCGRKSEIEAERCNNDGIKVFKVAEPTGPFFSYEPPMPNNFGNEPNSVDALEDSYISLQKSDKIPKHKLTQGAFAKVDTPKGTVFSLYSGRMLTKEEMEAYTKLSKEQVQQVKDEHSNNLEVANDFAESLWMNRIPTACKMAIDIPPQYADTEKYNGTLGHKVNHDFKPNSEYIRAYDSARFGLVVALKTTRDVKKGEEFLVNYGYHYNIGPKWYKELFRASMKKEPKMKKTHAGLLHGVDDDNLDAEIKDTPLPVHLSISNDIEVTDEKLDVINESVEEKPIIHNILGSTYWY